MTEFNPAIPLAMARRATVLGHDLAKGSALEIVADPEKPGQVTEPVARLLWARGIAVAADQVRPTPVETPEQEAARLKAETERAARASVLPAVEPIAAPEPTPAGEPAKRRQRAQQAED